MPRKSKADKEQEDSDSKKKEAPITQGAVTSENVSGIEAVSDEHAQALGQVRGGGGMGTGAAGCTVAGPAVHVATEGGRKPLPVADLPEGVTTKGGADASDQPTSQDAALVTGNDGPPSDEDKANAETPDQGEGDED